MTVSRTVLRADAALTAGGVIAPVEIEFGETITYIGAPRETETVGSGTAGAVVSLEGHVIMPGLVNAHTHSAMTLMRNVADEQGFMPWLETVQSVEQRLTAPDIRAGLELAMLEMIASGTTTFADMYFWDAELLETVKAAGMRVLAAPACTAADVVAFPGVAPWGGERVLDETEELARAYDGDPQVKLAYGPHAPYSSPPEFLAEVSRRSAKSGLTVHTHVAESLAEMRIIGERHAKTPVEHLEALGLLNERLLAAHCVHVSGADIGAATIAGAAVVHNPISNLKLGCGIAPLPKLLAHGLRVGLGTDSVASNNSLDLFEEIKLAALLHRGAGHDASAVSAAEALELATRGGAFATGFTETGTLEVGRQADLIVLTTTGEAGSPFRAENLPSHLAFTATGADVRQVFIGGRHVYREGEFLTLDRADILARARAASDRLALGATPS